jgi:hypothetical protein
VAIAAGGHNHGSLELGRTTGPDYSPCKLSDTYTDIAELSESPNLPLHSTATTMISSDNRVMAGTLSYHNSHHNLTEHHSQNTNVLDESMPELDRLSPLPHILNHAAMQENFHSQGTAFIVVNGMMVIQPDESDAMVDELEDWDWCEVSRIVVAAAQAEAASQLEHNDDDAVVMSESASDLESESLALDTMNKYIDWPESNSE